MDDCIFCKIVAGEIPSEFLFEDNDLIAFEDINPVAPTHVLIVPKKHIATLNDLRESDAALVGKMFLAAKDIAKSKGISEEGYRAVFNCMAGAGQAVFHIHLHLLGGRPLQWPPG
ncbi:MAG: histidine triad nucleotide-binding protein [bacterium]